MTRKADDALSIQAVWFATAAGWDQPDAAEWCRDASLDPVEWRTREDDDSTTTHHIAVIAQPDVFDPDSFRTIADDFPEGVSATVGQRKTMPQQRNPEQAQRAVGHQSDDDPYTFIMSDETVDRMGDIIRAAGWGLRNFRKNSIALFNHDYDKVIGTWANVRVEGKQLLGDLKLAARGTSRLVDEIHSLIEQRVLRAVSVGFQPIDFEWMENSAGKTTGGIEFTKQDLLECSLVSVPANPSALAVARSIGISDATRALIFGKPGAPGGKGLNSARHAARSAPASPRAPTGSIGRNPKAKEAGPMTIAERIQAKQERLVAIKDRLTELKSLVEADPDCDLSEDEVAELEALESEQEAVNKSVEALNRIENGLAAKAVPATRPQAPSAARTPASAKKPEKGGSLLVKSMTAAVLGHMTQRRASDVLSEIYGDDDRVMAASKLYVGRQRDATSLADTTTPGWAAELVRNDLRGFLEDLRARSVYAQLLNAPGARSLDFDGANSVTIPSRARGDQSNGPVTGAAAAQHLGHQMGGSWVGEGGVIPVKQMALTSQTLNRYKLAVISAFTNEILEQSTPSIEAIIRDAILEDTALAVDGGLLDGVPAQAGIRPASIMAGVAPTASAGNTAADIIADLRTLLDSMSGINGASPVLIMNSNRLLGLSTVQTIAGGFMFRDEIASGRLLGMPVLSSTTVAPSVVVIVDAGSFIGANDTPQFMVSDQATLTMANARTGTPTQADDGAGAPGEPERVPPDGGINVVGGAAAEGAAGAGYQAMSLYQQYATAVRMVMPAAWGTIRPGAVAAIDNVAW